MEAIAWNKEDKCGSASHRVTLLWDRLKVRS